MSDHEFQQNGPGIIGSDICTVCGKEREDHEPVARIASLQEQVERLTRERDEARRFAGMGCDANDGGPHSIIQQGTYKFCKDCGSTIKNPSLTERCRAAEARANAAEAQLAEANKALERLGTFETFTVEGWGFAHPEITARVEFARRAREAQGGENG